MLRRSFFQHLIALSLSLLIAGPNTSNPVVTTRHGYQKPTHTAELLKEGMRLAWLDNWAAAASVFKRAKFLFRKNGDKRSEIYAHVGTLRSQVLPLDVVSRYLTSQ